MQVRALSDTLSTTGQIAVEDLPAIQAQGFKSILICRPDGEGDQPPSQTIAGAAEKLGLTTAYVPFNMGQNPGEILPDFAAQAGALEGPTLGYCKSGMRVAVLWALSQRGKLSADEILKAGADAGYDLSMIAPAL